MAASTISPPMYDVRSLGFETLATLRLFISGYCNLIEEVCSPQSSSHDRGKLRYDALVAPKKKKNGATNIYSFPLDGLMK